MKRNNIEEQNCIAFIARLEQYYPEIAELCYHIPNESRISQKTNIGIRKGIPDYFLAIPRDNFHGLYIEFKRPGGKLSKDQVDMMLLLISKGYCCEVAYSWDQGIKIVDDYLKNTFL